MTRPILRTSRCLRCFSQLRYRSKEKVTYCGFCGAAL